MNISCAYIRCDCKRDIQLSGEGRPTKIRRATVVRVWL